MLKTVITGCSMVFPILKSNLHPDLLENLDKKKAHTILIRF